MKPHYHILVIPEIESITTEMISWFSDSIGRYGLVNNFEKGIVLYKLMEWR